MCYFKACIDYRNIRERQQKWVIYISIFEIKVSLMSLGLFTTYWLTEWNLDKIKIYFANLKTTLWRFFRKVYLYWWIYSEKKTTGFLKAWALILNNCCFFYAALQRRRNSYAFTKCKLNLWCTYYSNGNNSFHQVIILINPRNVMHCHGFANWCWVLEKKNSY